MRRLPTAVLLSLVVLNSAAAPEWEDGAVLVRVVDVGAGLCCVAKIAGEDDDHHYVIFDTGNYEDDGDTAMEVIRELVPQDDTIDLLVLSHTDSDHNAAVPEIVNEYYLDRVLRTGSKHYDRFPATLRDARESIVWAVEQEGTLDLNLNEVEFPNGATYRFGDTFVTLVCGFGVAPRRGT